MRNIVSTSSFTPWPQYTVEEADAVRSVILSNKVNYWSGEICDLFEKEFAAWIGTKHAIALANGTVALEAALKALHLNAEDEVIVTARSFIASASCIIQAGAIPVFADVDLNSQNITIDTIRAVLTPKTKAIICVHLAGWPCDMDPILELAQQHNLWVIEDCAQAHGAQYKGRPVGGIGHVAAWSFCQDKIMTTGGEGGMITTNDSELWSRIWSYKDHGKSPDYLHQESLWNRSTAHLEYTSIGTNLRMLELQAAIGRIQLKKMHDWHILRNNNLRKIWSCAASIQGLRVPKFPEQLDHAAYKAYVFVELGQLDPSWNRDAILNEIRNRGVPCFRGATPELYREKSFQHLAFSSPTRLPNAQHLGETSLMFLIHPVLTTAEIEKTCQIIQEVMVLATTASARLASSLNFLDSN